MNLSIEELRIEQARREAYSHLLNVLGEDFELIESILCAFDDCEEQDFADLAFSDESLPINPIINLNKKS